VFSGLIALALFNSLFAMSYLTLLPIYADQYSTRFPGFRSAEYRSRSRSAPGNLTIATIAHLIPAPREGAARRAGLRGGGADGVLEISGARPGAADLVLVGFCKYLLLIRWSTFSAACADHLRGPRHELYSLCWNLLPLGACSPAHSPQQWTPASPSSSAGIMVTANALLLITSKRLRAIPSF